MNERHKICIESFCDCLGIRAGMKNATMVEDCRSATAGFLKRWYMRRFGHALRCGDGEPLNKARLGCSKAASGAITLYQLALIEAGTPYGLTPAGMLALDVARIEAGLMLLDVDYVSARKALVDSQTSSPYELDLA